jgi:filamentous hemagglutinin
MDEQVIVEGNHRYIAAKVVGKTVEVQPWRAPAGKVTKPISDIKIDPVDWGNK